MTMKKWDVGRLFTVAAGSVMLPMLPTHSMILAIQIYRSGPGKSLVRHLDIGVKVALPHL